MARSGAARPRWFLLLFLLPLAALDVGCADPNPTFVFFVDAAPAPRDAGPPEVGGFDATVGNTDDAGDDADAGSPP